MESIHSFLNEDVLTNNLTWEEEIQENCSDVFIESTIETKYVKPMTLTIKAWISKTKNEIYWNIESDVPCTSPLDDHPFSMVVEKDEGDTSTEGGIIKNSDLAKELLRNLAKPDKELKEIAGLHGPNFCRKQMICMLYSLVSN